MDGDKIAKKHFPNRAQFREWTESERHEIIREALSNGETLPSVLKTLLDWYKLNEWNEVRMNQ